MAQNPLAAVISEAMGKLIDTRGAVLIAFAQVEWFLAKFVAPAATYDRYKHLDLSFSQDAEKRAQRLREILAVEGPFSKYADALTKSVDAALNSRNSEIFVPTDCWCDPMIFTSIRKCISGCSGCIGAGN